MTVESQIHAAAAQLVAPGAQVGRVHRYRNAPMPFPARLELITADGRRDYVVKTAGDLDRSALEAAALRALADLGFPAPQVVAGPRLVQTDDGPFAVLVMTRLPGAALPWIGVSDVATVDRTCRLLLDAVDQLHALSPRVAAHAIGADLPEHSLDRELAEVAARNSPWCDAPIFQQAMEILDEQLPHHRMPLVFSSGDYNPLNVLADSDGLTGWVDFEFARWEDPLIGFPKFSFWADDSGWRLGSQSGLVERFLFRRRIDPRTYLLRVVLRGLNHLLDTTPDAPPTVLLREVDSAVRTLRQRQ